MIETPIAVGAQWTNSATLKSPSYPSYASDTMGSWTTLPAVIIPSGVTLAAPLAPLANVAGSLSFEGENLAGAARVAQAVNDPSSPYFQHFLSGNQFASAFGPNPAQQRELAEYLQNHDISISVVSPFLWNVRGPAIEMDSAFGTSFVHAFTSDGHEGWAPALPMRLPSNVASGVVPTGAFQNARPPPPDLLVTPAPLSPPSSNGPSTSTLTLDVSNEFKSTILGGPGVVAPTGLNETYTLTIGGGTAPYNVTWNWGDGTVQETQTASSTLSLFHTYYLPGQVDICGRSCTGLNISANDTLGDSGAYRIGVFPATSPQTAQLFYNSVPLYQLGYSGQGTKIGLDEVCDTSFATSQYLIDMNAFSAAFGLPLMTTSTLQLVGSGNSDPNCAMNGGGSTGWAGETELDMEWVHALAPNATIVMDLSASLIQEGDVAWTDLSNGVFIDSNSWGCPYWDNASGCDYSWTTWEQAASQGESYLTSSGDGGAFYATDTPSDTSFGVSVGGTSIYPNPAGTFGAEYAWNGTNMTTMGGSHHGGTGGGYASGGDGNVSIPAPWYQVGTPGFTGPYRGVPDVASLGGTWEMTREGGAWARHAGTSLSSPAWAAVLDLMYEYNGTANRANGLANGELYAIAKGPNYNAGFHDITIGNNINYGFGYDDTVGWDPVTGLGSPNVANLAMLLAEESGDVCAVAPLTSTLSANVTYGPAGLSVYFGVDASGGSNDLSGYTYAWDFGDGSPIVTSGQPTATYAYPTAGTYYASVTVNATTASGPSSSTTNHLPIVVTGAGGNPTPLAAVAQATGVQGTSPLLVSFSATALGGTGPYSYGWIFGEGTPSSSQNPSHNYSTPGFFTAALTVTDHVGATATSYVAVRGCLSPLTLSVPHASRAAADVGQSLTFTTSASGGAGGFTFGWTGITLAGCTGATTATLTCSTIPSGNWSVHATVADSQGNRQESSGVPIVITADPSAPAPAASSVSVELGATLTFTENASGGVGTLHYSWLGLPTGCTSTDVAILSGCTPTSVGSFLVSVNVTDANGYSVDSPQVTVVVGSVPSVSVKSTVGAADVGQSVTFNASGSGGLGTYSYSWSGLPSGCVGTVAATVTCQPRSAGTFTVGVTATDRGGGTSGRTTLTFRVFADPVILAFGAVPSTLTVGGSTNLTVDAALGNGVYSYAYSGLPAGCTSANVTPLECAPTVAGNFTVTVSVTDGNGFVAQSTTLLSVNGGSSTAGGSSSGLSTEELELVGVGAVVLAAVAIAAVVLVRKRKSSTKAKEPEADEEPDT